MLQISLSGTGDENAQVGSEQHIGILAHGVVRLDRPAVERHHERAAGRISDGAVLGKVHAAGRAEFERAAALEGNLHGLVSSGDRAAIAQQCLAMRDVHRARRLAPQWPRCGR